MEKEIEKQRFDAIQELSQIEMKLSDARVAFENLKKAEEEYLVARETKVSEKLDTMLQSLNDAFSSFLENKDTFEKIKAIVSEFSNKAVNLTAQVKDVYGILTEKIKIADNIIEVKMIKLIDESVRIAEERKTLNERLESLEKLMSSLALEEKSFNDEKLKFEKKWQELNK